MATTICCDCCGTLIPVTAADRGGEVVCPVSRRFVPVPMDVAPVATPAPVAPRRRFPVAAAAIALLLMLLCGVGGVALRQTVTPAAGDAGRDAATINVPALPPPAAPPPTVTGPSRPVGTAPAIVPVPLILARPADSDRTPTAGRPPIPTPVPAPTRPAMPPTPPAPAAGLDAQPADPHPPLKPARRLKSRLDTRSTADLEADLLRVREVSLDTPRQPTASLDLARAAATLIGSGGSYAGPILLTKSRPDLAALPWRVGPRTVLNVDAARELTGLAKRFRADLQSCTGAGDARPDPERVRAMLLAGDPPKWATAAAVPCLRQMLPGEVARTRGAATEAFRRTPGDAALDALVAAAAFDTDFDNRADAVEALAERDPAAVATRLAAVLDYPWTPAVEHAAEAIVALNLAAAVPPLAGELRRDSAEALTVPVAAKPHTVRREMVRVNHARNCLLCHAPSLDRNDFVRGALPDPTKPLGGPTAYYDNSQVFVRADTTYLRQDFSVVQPVPNPGPWPTHQRYDYVVALRPTGDNDGPADDAGRHAALRFALEGVTGTAETAAAPAAVRDFVTETALMESLRRAPEPTVILNFAEYGRPLLALSEDAVSVVLAQLRRRYGEAARYALIAYLRPLLTTGTAAQRETAAGLLARLEDAAAWGRPLTDGERAAARRVLKSGTGQLRGDAARVFLDDPAAATKCPDELLALLGSDDADLRRAAAVALGRATSLSDALHLALAKAARDDAQAVREAASVTLAKLGFVPQAAGLELARSFLARLTWANAQDRTAFAARLYPLLAKLAPTDETWFTPLVAAATGTTPTDATDADIAKLLELHRKFPGRAIGDLVPLLCHATYGPVVEAILVSAPDEAYKPLLEGLKAATPGVRAAAAKVLAKTAALRNGGNHWRETLDALTALAKNDPNTDVRIIASAEAKRLAAAR